MGRDGRTSLVRLHSQALTGTGKSSLFSVQQTTKNAQLVRIVLKVLAQHIYMGTNPARGQLNKENDVSPGPVCA